MARKQGATDDFIGAAEHLVQRGYLCAGDLRRFQQGLSLTACVAQRPDLFGAAIVAVPLLDMLRFQNFPMARYWVPEYGSAEKADQHGVPGDTRPILSERHEIPAVLLTAGENDRLRARAARTPSDGRPAPGFERVDLTKKPGPAVGRPRGRARAGQASEPCVRDAADQRCFLMWQLGMLETPRRSTELETQADRRRRMQIIPAPWFRPGCCRSGSLTPLIEETCWPCDIGVVRHGRAKPSYCFTAVTSRFVM